MRTFPMALLIAAGLSLAAQAPAAKPAAEPSVGASLDATFMWVSGQFIPAAEAMPEDKFDWAPSTQGEFKGVKTFAQQVKHIAAVNYLLGAHLLGEKPPVATGNPEMGPDEIKTKADIVKYLKDSYAYAHKAVQSISTAGSTKALKNPFGQGDLTPVGIANLLAFHGMDHYGQMVVYLRMNGIVPPASRPRPAAAAH